MTLSRKSRGPLGLCALAMVSAGLLLAPTGAQATETGRVVAWGCAAPLSDAGQCSVPSPLSDVTALAASEFHSLALTGGTVVAWGCGPFYDFGQCSVPPTLSNVTAIAAGWEHSLALQSNGTVVAWGCGNAADVGDCNVPPTLAGVTAIAAGGYHSLALTGGTVVAWGCGGRFISSDFGQCSVPPGLTGVTAIAAANFHSLALKNTGTVVAWGCRDRDAGQCDVPGDLSGVTAIAAGHTHSLALTNTGTVVAWGCLNDSDYGQCQVPPELTGEVTAIAAGFAHSLALKRDGTVVAWGCAVPWLVDAACDVPNGLSGVTAIAAGWEHSLALGSFADHYKAYTVDRQESFAKVPGVVLSDQFGMEQVIVKKPELLLNPVEKRTPDDGQIFSISKPDLHSVCYQIKDDKDGDFPNFQKRQVKVSNQFGTLNLEVTKPSKLCAPASKSETSQPPVAVPNGNHYKCYDVKDHDQFDKVSGIGLTDQFGQEQVVVEKPELLCNPVEKRIGTQVFPIQQPENHLLCYSIKDNPFQQRSVTTLDQFGAASLTVKKPEMLCVPSQKTLL